MDIEERKAYVRGHRTAVFGYNRREDGPSMSVVSYVMDGDDILVCTMADRAKAKAVARNPRVSLCVLDEQWPLTYLGVYCTATVETDFGATVELLMRLAGVMAREEMPESKRESIAVWAKEEKRVTLRLKPYATFETPPRHVHNADDVDSLTHCLAQPFRGSTSRLASRSRSFADDPEKAGVAETACGSEACAYAADQQRCWRLTGVWALAGLVLAGTTAPGFGRRRRRRDQPISLAMPETLPESCIRTRLMCLSRRKRSRNAIVTCSTTPR